MRKTTLDKAIDMLDARPGSEPWFVALECNETAAVQAAFFEGLDEGRAVEAAAYEYLRAFPVVIRDDRRIGEARTFGILKGARS